MGQKLLGHDRFSEKEQLKHSEHATIPLCMAMPKTSAQDLKISFASKVSVERSLNLCSIKLKLGSMKKSEIASLICQNTDQFFLRKTSCSQTFPSWA